MRIMTVQDRTTDQVYNLVVPEGAKDVNVLADFLGDGQIAYYSVEFQDYIPVSSDSTQFEQENARLSAKIQEQSEELHARTQELQSMAKRLVDRGRQIDLQATAEVELRDRIRQLEIALEKAPTWPVEAEPEALTNIFTTPLGPIPSPPRGWADPVER
jgi:hypothetical protein